MGINGHSSEQMFMKHTGKTTHDNAHQMLNIMLNWLLPINNENK
jgi:hypothetical protein